MKNKLLTLIYFCVFLMRIHSVQISVNKKVKKAHLKSDIPKATNKTHRANQHKASNRTHDAPGGSRQEIAYNLDLIHNNESSTLMYSQDKDVVNGALTEWSTWSECAKDCGKRSLRSRERYCTNPTPSNGGADCEGERFQLNLCRLVPCHTTTVRPKPPDDVSSSHRSFDSDNGDKKGTEDVRWRLGEWSGWSKCYCSKAYQKRNRKCYSHGGIPCTGDTVETKPCQPKGCEETEKSSLVNVDPKAFCGFNPCDYSKCLLAPLGSCVSDYKCRPVFFDEKNKRAEDCVGKHVYINTEKVLKVCKVNPCDYSRCLLDFTEERCIVGTRCQAVYYNADGQPQKCTAILKVPARQVCGYDPCSGKTCQDRPNARCLVTSKCRPIYVNAFNERIKKCEEKAGGTKSKISSGKEDEYETEPDYDEDDSDDDDEDDNDSDGDKEKTFAKYEQEEEEEKEEDNSIDDKHYNDHDNDDEDNYDDHDDHNDHDDHDHNNDHNDHDYHDDHDYHNDHDDHDYHNDHNNDHDDHDDNDDDDYHKDEEDNFRIPAGLNTTQNTSPQNVTKPLLNLKSTKNEKGQRRTEKSPGKVFSKIFNASSLNLADIVKGKLKNSQGVVTGTVESSMKIISNKKPATFYYFEAKGGVANESRQFMVITAPKTKKSSVLTKSRHTKQTK